MNRPETWATLALLALAALGFACDLGFDPINPDAGLYLPLAREMAQGKALYRELPCDYPPLGPSVLALLGQTTRSSPVHVMGLFIALQGVNAVLLGWLLQRLGHARPLALVGAALWLAWTWACEGSAIVLEPLVNLGLLAAAVATTFAGVSAAVVAGLFAGAALATKQYALLALPGLVGLVMARVHPRNAASSATAPAWARLACFSLGAATPFLLFCLDLQQTPSSLAWHLATFGGRDYGVIGPRTLLQALTNGGPALPLSVVAALALCTAVLRPTARSVAVVLLLIGMTLPLTVRDYPHYVQLAAPWGVVALVEAAALGSQSFAGSTASAGRLLIAGALVWLPVWLAALGAIVPELRERPRDQQRLVAEFVRQKLSAGEPCVIVGAPWLYALAELRAAGDDYRFVSSLTGGSAAEQVRRDGLLARAAAVVSTAPIEGEWPWAPAQPRFSSDNSKLYQVYIYHRAP
ncbi:MAG: MEDS domain-containing protein [Pirellulales bacterium]|nr:MEDS domain-containing protein [Pirellulales bacterium]